MERQISFAHEDVTLILKATVETVTDCEWIIGVFSERVISIENLKKEIKNAKQIDSACGLSLDIPYARRQYVLSFTK